MSVKWVRYSEIFSNIKFLLYNHNDNFIYKYIYIYISMGVYFFIWCNSPQWARASSFTRYVDDTQRRTTVSRTPLDEWSTRNRDLYVTTQNTDNRQTSMSLVRFEPTISAGERPQIYALDRATLGPAMCVNNKLKFSKYKRNFAITNVGNKFRLCRKKWAKSFVLSINLILHLHF
jgi:hypothetical protein